MGRGPGTLAVLFASVSVIEAKRCFPVFLPSARLRGSVFGLGNKKYLTLLCPVPVLNLLLHLCSVSAKLTEGLCLSRSHEVAWLFKNHSAHQTVFLPKSLSMVFKWLNVEVMAGYV